MSNKCKKKQILNYNTNLSKCLYQIKSCNIYLFNVVEDGMHIPVREEDPSPQEMVNGLPRRLLDSVE